MSVTTIDSNRQILEERMFLPNVGRALAGVLMAGILVGSPVSAAPPTTTEASSPSVGAENAIPDLASVGPSSKSARHIALGVSMMPYSDLSVLDSFTASVGGRAPALWSVWSDWGNPGNSAFPTALMNGLRQRGVEPMVFWQPDDPSNLDPNLFSYQKIVNGQFDAYITQWARAAKQWGGTLIVRFAHEMDGYWFPWYVYGGPNTGPLFKKAWQHIWNIFKGPHGVGATNVRFLWSPYLPRTALYPGNQYVDYVGFTALNWGPPAYPWRSMQDLFATSMRKLATYTSKPVIIAEMGSSASGGSKADWITLGYPALFNAYPSIVALSYFNISVPGQSDWLLTNPADAMSAYSRIAADSRFAGGLTAPNVTLSLPKASTKGKVKVTLTSSDAGGNGIAGYYLSASPTPPSAGTTWSAAKPTTFTFAKGKGTRTLYAWVKDRNGVTSPRASATTVLR